MGGTYVATVGDRGRFVLPAAIREARDLGEGTRLVVVDTGEGVVLLTQAQARARLAAQLSGRDLVAALLGERRAAAAREDDQTVAP